MGSSKLAAFLSSESRFSADCNPGGLSRYLGMVENKVH